MPSSTTGQRAPLRVMSYNLRGLKDDKDTVAAVVRAVDPDVLLVQEAPRWPGSSYAMTAFARECGLLWSGRQALLGQTTLLTSIRVDAKDNVDRRLKVGLRETPRNYTVSRIRRADGLRATVVSVHLSLLGDQRVRHITQVLAQLADDPLVVDDEPLIIGGDLNEGRDGTAWGALAEQLVEVSDDRFTFPSKDPRVRIDAIFGRGHQQVTPGDPSILDGLDLVAATDHLPVWVDLHY